jgi:hypothetical protein
MHTHTHEDGTEHELPQSPSETMALLNYMAAHNYSHAKELQEMAERLRSEGHSEPADFVLQAAEYLIDAGAELGDAVHVLSHELGIDHGH